MVFRLDLGDTALSIVWDIIGLVGVGTGAIIGLGYAFSMVTASQALEAISAVGGIIGIATVIVLVFGAIEGAIERQVGLSSNGHAHWLSANCMNRGCETQSTRYGQNVQR